MTLFSPITMRISLLFPCVLLCSLCACDSVTNNQTEEDVRVRVRLRYEVEATYATCTVARNNALRQAEQSTVAAFPWEDQLTVEATVRVPFVASIAATCTDSTKAGKSTVLIYAEEELVARGTAAGYGATATATFQVTPGN